MQMCPSDIVMGMTGTTPEWLKPLDQRYLAGEAGPMPNAVKLAAVLSGVSAVPAAGVGIINLSMTVDLIANRPPGWGTNLTFVPLVGLAGAAMFVVFTLGVRAIPAKGWARLPTLSGLVLAGIAFVAFLLTVLG